MGIRHDAATDRLSRTASAPGLPVTVLGWSCLRVDRNDFSSVFRAHSGGGGTTCYNIATGSSGETLCIFTPAGGTVIGTAPFVVNTWLPWAATISAVSGTLYLANASTGVLSSATAAITAGVPDAYTIGGRSPGDPNEWWNGSHGFLRLLTGVLTPGALVDELFNRRSRHPNIWADYDFIDGSLLDISGNSRHLTAGSTATAADEDPPIGPSDRMLVMF